MNQRYGYGTGRNHDYYSPWPSYAPPHAYGSGYPSQEMTPQQREEIEQAIRQADTLMERIKNDPMIWR